VLLILGLGCSIIFTLLELIGFAAAVQYPIDLGKFTYHKQKLILLLVDIIFAISILIVYLLQPTAELIIAIVVSLQLLMGVIYISILSILCKKKFYRNIVDEIQRLDLDIEEDLIELRRKLMEHSDIFCSVQDLQKAINMFSIKR